MLPDSVNVEKKVQFALETWKTTVGVQQHFNTIEMQIRSLAVTVLTAVIAAAGLVYNQTQQALVAAVKTGGPTPPMQTTRVFGIPLSAADMIIVAGLIAWMAFYFMDRWWYHRLLKAAVDQAWSIEKYMKKTPYGDVMGLTGAISDGSPIRLLWWNLHSEQKIDFFYGTIALVLVLIVAFVF